MTTGDKITWSYRSLIFMGLFWMRFVEKYIPIWGVLAIWLPSLFFIWRRRGEREVESGKI